MRRTYKAVAALAAVVALLTVNASPSAAETATVTGGSITVNLIPALTQTLGTTTGSCTSTISFDFSTSLTSGTSSLTLTSHFVYSSGNYIFRMTFSPVHLDSAHITTGTNTSKYNLDLQNSTGTSQAMLITDVMVYASDSATDCNPADEDGTGPDTADTPKCADINATLPHFYGLLTVNGTITHDGTSHHTVPSSSTAAFFGTAGTPGTPVVAGIAAAGCTPPFSALNGKTATISGLTVHVD